MEPSGKKRKLNEGGEGLVNADADDAGKSERSVYSFHDKKRCVAPYTFEFKTKVKQRWFGRGVLEVFQQEFRSYNPDYYEKAIMLGTLTVNGAPAAPTYKLKNGDEVLHKAHRHEPPVAVDEVTVLDETDDLLVVNKPSTIPVHPCGAYRHNTVTGIIASMRPELKLHLIYRLDRLTSGLVMLGKSPQVASRMSAAVREGRTRKIYLARVKGDFSTLLSDQQLRSPPGAPEVLFDAWIAGREDEDGGIKADGGAAPVMEHVVQSDGSLRVRVPIKCLSHRDGLYGCSADGKPSVTLMRLRWTDGVHSVVECRLITGRTHQVRLHLQWVGYPIANDPNYGDEETVTAFRDKWRRKRQEPSTLSQSSIEVQPTVPTIKEGTSDEERVRSICPYCCEGGNNMFKDEQLHHTGIWLHAWKYVGETWAYEAPMPPWALPSEIKEA